jgi:mono/diheme cytochrome c family protein
MKFGIRAKFLTVAIASLVAIVNIAGCGKKAPLSLYPLVNQKDLSEGMKLFNSRCAICHGAPDKGIPPRFAAILKDPIIRCDTQEFAYAILYAKGHQIKTGYLYENLSDSEIAKIGNYLINQSGQKDVQMRARTVQRAREIHAIKTGESLNEPSKSATPPSQPSPAVHTVLLPDALPSETK